MGGQADESPRADGYRNVILIFRHQDKDYNSTQKDLELHRGLKNMTLLGVGHHVRSIEH